MSDFIILPDFSSANSVIAYFATVGIQLILFIFVLVVLNCFVFRPTLKVMGIRKKTIGELETKTGEVIKKSGILMEEYKWRIDGASRLASEKREIMRLIGKRRADMILTAAKKETNKDIEDIIETTKSSYANALPSAGKSIHEFAEDICEKVLTD